MAAESFWNRSGSAVARRSCRPPQAALRKPGGTRGEARTDPVRASAGLSGCGALRHNVFSLRLRCLEPSALSLEPFALCRLELLRVCPAASILARVWRSARRDRRGLKFALALFLPSFRPVPSSSFRRPRFPRFPALRRAFAFLALLAIPCPPRGARGQRAPV